MEASTNTPTHAHDNEHDQGPDGRHGHGDGRLVVLPVNDQPVRFRQGTNTGLEIKQIAIAQGVAIGVEFLLTVVYPNGDAQEIGDADPVRIQEGLEFVAIPDDDNS